MPIINVTNSSGETRSVQVSTGISLMEALRDNGFEEILALCGGCCSCATCHVHIAAPAKQPLPVMEEDELMLLELADNYDADLSRLSCQIELVDEYEGLEITLVDND
ncbi:MAG: 2Fe-2S iron-sulfur cluster binding domain-containing protein [Arenicella sp.]|nr:2Fe-2S iron-sulfur cluster binding domain-containing protein [Arenicella sp.]